MKYTNPLIFSFFSLLSIMISFDTLAETKLCKDIWPNRFSDTRHASKKCVEQSDVDTKTDYLYFSIPSLGDLESQKRAEILTKQAIRETLAVIKTWGGTVLPIWAVYIHDFSPISEGDGQTRNYAYVLWDNVQSNEGCPLYLFKNIHEKDEAFIKQVVAHEIMHCYQHWNYFDKFTDNTPETHNWWIEGGAEALSDIVYPNGHAEKKIVSYYNPNLSLFKQKDGYRVGLYWMSYIQDQGLESLLKNFDDYISGAEGVDQQVKKWGENYKTSGSFHNFARRFIDQNVLDHGGNRMPTIILPAVSEMGAPPVSYKIENYQVEPYMINLVRINFKKDKFYKLNFLKIAGSDDEFSVSYRKKGEKEWHEHMVYGTDFPWKKDTSCQQDASYEFVITTAGNNLETKKIDLDFFVEDSACECEDTLGADQCLTGRWYLDHKSFEDYYRRQVVDRIGGKNAEYHGTSGDLIIEIRDNKDYAIIAEQFSTELTFITGDTENNPMRFLTEILLKGRLDTRYGRPQAGKLCLLKGTSTAVAHIKVNYNGNDVNDSEIDLTPSEGQTLDYVCTKNMLQLRARPKGSDQVIDLLFKR